MIKPIALLNVLVALGFASTPPAVADVQVRHRDDYQSLVDISGEITNQDVRAFNNIVRQLKNRTLAIRLNSPGGDVLAAMQIGRTIRKLDGKTVVPIGSKCYSSCALIFISGVTRGNYGELGLHRPFLASAPLNRQAIEDQYPEILVQIKRFVSEMGITDDFYQQMVNSEPSEMVIYTDENYTSLVPTDDPVYQEISVAYWARLYGVTTLALRQRRIDSERCGSNWTCREAIMWGVSERVYLERESMMNACNDLSEEDQLVLKDAPRGQEMDHPLTLQIEACMRKVMLGR